jgi:hypothetical protein
MTDTSQFFDFVLILVTTGALAIVGGCNEIADDSTPELCEKG